MSKLLKLKNYIIEEFIPDQNGDGIDDDMDLIASGILDSLAILKLVAFIENTYEVALEPEEIDPENLSSISAIHKLIASKSEQAVEYA